MFHGLANKTGKTYRSITTFNGAVFFAMLQAAAKKFSVCIWLYMDSKNSLPVGGRTEHLVIHTIMTWGHTVTGL
jgi:hypothetical protein